MMKAGDLGGAADWYLEWVKQGGKCISMRKNNPDGAEYPLDGLYVWRLLRGLAPRSANHRAQASKRRRQTTA